MTRHVSDSPAADTVVFIHGLWLTSRSWENWVPRYENSGWKVLAPGWPGMDASVEELNRDSSPIAKLDVTQVADHYEQIVRALDKPPIIIGHSLGGTVMQILLDRGLGAAGVGLASATVKGVPDLPLSTIWATFPVLGNPFSSDKATPLSPEQFHYAFVNTLSKEEADKVYARYHVPCANHVLFEAAFANMQRNAATQVDFAKADRAPMLLAAFEHDHIVPPNASRHNAEKYDKSKADVEFHEFLGRPHFPGVPGWEDVADYVLDWAVQAQKV